MEQRFAGATVAVLATGPSMSAHVADSVRGLHVIAANDAYRLAPWADVLVAQDRAWWAAHPDALKFRGLKLSANRISGVEQIPADGLMQTSLNSGAAAVYVALKMGAERVLMFGFDMHGDHFFGRHPAGLKNSAPGHYRRFMRQFDRMRRLADGRVFNCTPGSALKTFPYMEWRGEAAGLHETAAAA